MRRVARDSCLQKCTPAFISLSTHHSQLKARKQSLYESAKTNYMKVFFKTFGKHLLNFSVKIAVCVLYSA